MTAPNSSTIPSVMTAAVLMGHGGPDKLQLRHDWPVPTPKPGEALIRVTACGMNNTDINTRVAWYDDATDASTNEVATANGAMTRGTSAGTWASAALSFPRIQGADVVGRIVALGDKVPDHSAWLGARVIADPWIRSDGPAASFVGSELDGGFAQFVALPVSNLARVANEAWSDVALASVPCAYTTAENMLHRADVGAADTVLVTGASGGVGSALVQLCKRRGAKVIAVTSAGKKKAVLSLGADAVIQRGADDWKHVVCEATGRDMVTVVADVVGAPTFPSAMKLLGRGGRYVTSGAIGGKCVTVDLTKLYLFDWSMLGCTVTAPEVFPNLVKYIERGEMRPVVAETFALEEIHKAQELFLRKEHVGNIVMTL